MRFVISTNADIVIYNGPPVNRFLAEGYGCVRCRGKWQTISDGVDRGCAFVYRSCMGKTITLDDDAYQLLNSLKQGPGDSFTRVIRRHVFKPLETAGELLDYYETVPPPVVDPGALERIGKERGRRSNRRK